MNTNNDQPISKGNRPRVAGGIILILVGIAFLLGQWLNIGTYLMLFLGAVMLVWGTTSRTIGWIIPGGVLSGIGLGIVALEGPLKLSGLPDGQSGGAFLLCFALGWFLIMACSWLAGCKMWWPLIPGGIMALVGGLLFMQDFGLRVLELANYIWPLALILTGGYLILRWSRKNS